MTTHKLYLHPYQNDFPDQFKKMKDKLILALPKSTVIHHVGSTSISGVGGKGIIDILIGLPSWHHEKEILSDLKDIGYKHVHPREHGRIFLSPRAETKTGDSHLHMVLKDSAAYRDLLLFRNRLRANKSLAKEYQEIKKRLAKDASQDRATYGRAKSSFIKKVVNYTANIA